MIEIDYLKLTSQEQHYSYIPRFVILEVLEEPLG